MEAFGVGCQERFRNDPGDVRWLQEVSGGFRMFKQVAEGFRRFRKVAEGFRMYQIKKKVVEAPTAVAAPGPAWTCASLISPSQ